jgi:hypothetical protein
MEKRWRTGLAVCVSIAAFCFIADWRTHSANGLTGDVVIWFVVAPYVFYRMRPKSPLS